MSLILLLLTFNLYKNFREKHEYFTTKKIVIIGLFLSIFLIQASLTIFQNDFAMLFNFDSATIIVTSIIFGPIEGFVYAIIADNLRVLINGFSWQFLYALVFPLMALVSGTIGRLFILNKLSVNTNTNFYKKRFTSFTIFQTAIITLYLFNILVFYLFSGAIEESNVKTIFFSSLIVTSTISICIYEIIYFILLLFKKYKMIYILSLLFLISFIDRYAISIWISSQADTNLWADNFGIVFVPRVYKSLYQVPISTFIWYVILQLTWKVYVKNEATTW